MIFLTCHQTGDVLALKPKGIHAVNPDQHGRGSWILMDTGHKFHVAEKSKEVAKLLKDAAAAQNGKKREEENG